MCDAWDPRERDEIVKAMQVDQVGESWEFERGELD